MYPTLLHVSSLTITGTCLCFTPKMFPECSPLTWFVNFYSCLNAQVLPVPQWCFLQLPQGNLTAPVDCHCLSLTWNLTHIMRCVSLQTWVIPQPRLPVSGTQKVCNKYILKEWILWIYSYINFKHILITSLKWITWRGYIRSLFTIIIVIIAYLFIHFLKTTSVFNKRQCWQVVLWSRERTWNVTLETTFK